MLTAYRDHGHALVCGITPNALMAELFGRKTGCSHGKGGSMHLFDVDHHMNGGNGIVGGHIPVATGVAFKIMYNEEDGVVLCFFGDGMDVLEVYDATVEAVKHAKENHLPSLLEIRTCRY